MTNYVPIALRQFVTARAAERCEYCHFPQAMSFLAFEIEHIISIKHGGTTVELNLALACPFCNRFKGTDLGSIDPETGFLTPFFHPRNQDWYAHFALEGPRIIPLSGEGRVTTLILQFNHPDRVAEREPLIETGIY